MSNNSGRISAYLLMFALLVGSIIHSAQASHMAARISAAGVTVAMSGDCDICRGGDESMSMSGACLAFCANVSAVFPVAESVTLELLAFPPAPAGELTVGFNSPPDPYPPRLFIPS